MPNGQNPFFTPNQKADASGSLDNILKLASLAKSGESGVVSKPTGDASQLGNAEGVDLQGGYQQSGNAPSALQPDVKQPQMMNQDPDQGDIFESSPFALGDVHGITKSIYG